jgi:uncharacterized protein YggE
MKGNANPASIEKPGSMITTRQEKAIIALLNEPSTKEAAAAAGVSEVTLWRWLQDDTFRAPYMQARRLAVQRAIARTQAVTSEAVETLREVMKSSVAMPSARVAAAKAILDYAMKGIELEDHENRLAEIERKLAAK